MSSTIILIEPFYTRSIAAPPEENTVKLIPSAILQYFLTDKVCGEKHNRSKTSVFGYKSIFFKA